MLLAVYKNMMRAATPLLEAYLQKRRRAGKEDPARARERRGRPGMPRGEGRIVWVHAASVGESMSMLALVDRLLALHPDIRILMTTGTVTSAGMMAERLPPRAFHQYVPVDHPAWVESFLDHWRPSLALWAESEFWPNILAALKARRVPAVLVSGRVTEKSARRWKRLAPGMAREILANFDLCLAQGARQAERLRDLGAGNVVTSSTLKYAAAPLPADEDKLQALRNEIGARPCVLWSSTHPGEEEHALAVHLAMKAQMPELLTIVVPRHPARGAEITQLFTAAGCRVAVRSHGEMLSSADVYLADTLGELGIFYRLCRYVVMCGSFVPMGGHNVIESAQLGCVNFTGPLVFNFQTVIDDFREHNAVIEVKDPRELTPLLLSALRQPEKYDAIAEAGKRLTASRAGILDDVARRISPYLAGGDA